MKIHPIVGADILERVAFPYPVAPIVRAHHEKWNGKGYPDGLKGEEIPIGARILAAVDCLDALASDRQYRKALPLDEAMKAVAEDSGISFDPRVVEVLQRRYLELEAIGGPRPLKRGKGRLIVSAIKWIVASGRQLDFKSTSTTLPAVNRIFSLPSHRHGRKRILCSS